MLIILAAEFSLTPAPVPDQNDVCSKEVFPIFTIENLRSPKAFAQNHKVAAFRNDKPSIQLTLFSAMIVVAVPCIPTLVVYFIFDESMRQTMLQLQSSGHEPSCDEPGSGPLYKLSDAVSREYTN